MLQKYFPILSEVNSPLAAMAALGFTASAAQIAMQGVSNSVLETLLWVSVSSTEIRRKEIETSVSQLAAARVAAKKELKAASYRAAMAARNARAVSRAAKRVTATRKPTTKASLRGLSGLSLDICRQRAVETQTAVRIAATTYNTAAQAVAQAIGGGDVRTIRAAIAALKVAVRTLEVRHIEFRFAREMLSIALARHSA